MSFSWPNGPTRQNRTTPQPLQTSTALMAKVIRNRWVFRKHNRWFRYLPRREDGSREYDFEKHSAMPDDFAQPMDVEAPKLWLVWRYRSTAGEPSWTVKRVRELFGTADVGKMHIFKNTSSVNDQLWHLKHLIEVRPIRFPMGEPTDADIPHMELRADGTCTIDRDCNVNPTEVKLVDEKWQQTPNYLRRQLKRRDNTFKDVYADAVYTPANISIMSTIRVVPLGAGQDVGRSCILVSIGGKNICLDCGMHMGYQDDRSYIGGGGKLNEYLDCVIISHFHLDHCGALPYMTEMVGYDGKIYMTHPTKAIVPVLLEDYRKIQTEVKGETNFFTVQMIKNCMKKVVEVSLHEVYEVDDEITIQAFYAGHVLGAAMFLIRVGNESVLYTGDFNMTPDRHLGAAHVFPGLRPDLLITETTYASTIRDSKRARERNFLQKITDTVFNGGKVLIPVFALGRVQELCILLDSYWERLDLKVPIYCSFGLADKATNYYRLFINWTNEKIKRNFVQRNMFNFKHISTLDPSFLDNPGPMVVFSTPGMLHGGQSLKIFKKWCGDEKNMIIMPGYCTAGTVGAKFDVKLGVEYMSFSAHADAKGIMQLIRDVEPANVMFVHGEDSKMTFLKAKVEKEFKIPVFKPANGETINVEAKMRVYVDLPENLIRKSLSLLGPNANKRFCPFSACVLMDNKTKSLQILAPADAARELGVQLHSVTFSEVFKIGTLNWKQLADQLRKFDPDLQEKSDGIDMFDSELLLAAVSNNANRVELIWDDSRENWLDVIKKEIGAEKLSPLELSAVYS
ncbi:Integrator complex subunit 11 [Aphelenchoides besseyi]|nr:Integrator complex subunit 11 [Aphelenchoides besseyi]